MSPNLGIHVLYFENTEVRWRSLSQLSRLPGNGHERRTMKIEIEIERMSLQEPLDPSLRENASETRQAKAGIFEHTAALFTVPCTHSSLIPIQRIDHRWPDKRAGSWCRCIHPVGYTQQQRLQLLPHQDTAGPSHRQGKRVPHNNPLDPRGPLAAYKPWLLKVRVAAYPLFVPVQRTVRLNPLFHSNAASTLASPDAHHRAFAHTHRSRSVPNSGQTIGRGPLQV